MPKDLRSREFLMSRLNGDNEEGAKVKASLVDLVDIDKNNKVDESKLVKKETYPEPTPDDPFEGVTFREVVGPRLEDFGRSMDTSIAFRSSKVTSEQVHNLAKPKKLTYEGSKLKASSPPLTPGDIKPEIEKHKETLEYAQVHEDLPLDFPLCSRDECPNVAHWAIQQSMEDDKSPIGFLCSGDFSSLPPKPDGSFYRVFKLSVRNYKSLVARAKENKLH